MNGRTPRVVDGDLDLVRGGLKQRTDGDLGVHGSISLAQALLEAGLVDRLSSSLLPSCTYTDASCSSYGTAARFSLIRSITSPSGCLLLDYEPSR